MSLDSRYEIVEKLGAGTFATVYRARDKELGREVAIKQIHDQYLEEEETLVRFWSEAQLLASLQHPNIVTVFDLEREKGWLILELMQTNLVERMQGRPMDVRAIKTTVAHCLRALKYLHGRGLIHGDIKPSNMMIDSRRRVKIGDFGLARRVSDEDGSLLKGTTRYMAPEVVSDEFGEVGPASDVYSLGFAAYELLCGKQFEDLFPGMSAFGRNKQVAWMMWHAAPDRRLPQIERVLEGVPEDLAHVIQTMCEKDQAKRYKSAEEALSDLNVDQKVIKADGTPAGPDGEMSEDEKSEDKKRTMIAAGAFGLSFLLSIIVLFWPGGKGEVNPDGDRKTYGIVRTVNSDGNRIQIEDPETGVPEEIQLGPKPPIFLRNEGRMILLRDLQPGDSVMVERKVVEEEKKEYLKITAARPVTQRGRIQEIDRHNSTVRIRLLNPSDGPNELTLRVPPRAKTSLNGSPILFSDIKQSDDVNVTHIADVRQDVGRHVQHLDVIRTSQASGFIKNFNLQSRMVTIQFGQSSAADSLTKPVGENCSVKVRGVGTNLTPIPISSLKLGDHVRVRYDVAIREMIVSQASNRFSGVVEGTIANSLTINTNQGQKLLSLSLDTDITLNQSSAKVEDLRKYDEVDVTYSEFEGKSVAHTIDTRRPVRNDRWALIISGARFQDRSLTRLKYSIDNARLVKESLISRYSFDPSRIVTLVDQNKATLMQQVQVALARNSATTQVIVYISGHAYQDNLGQTFYATTDFQFSEKSSGVPLDWFIAQLEACPSNDKMLLLDVSNSGDGRDLAMQPSTSEMVQSTTTPRNSTYIIASSSPRQRGLNFIDRSSSLFAWYVAQGFSGKADVDRNMMIAPMELHDYLQHEMSQVQIMGRVQTPALFSPQ